MTLRNGDWWIAVTLWIVTGVSFAAESNYTVVQYDAEGKTAIGLALVHGSDASLILATDGQLVHIDNKETAHRIRAVEESFQPATIVELRSSLQREFGSEFEIVATKHFLVVQNRGRGNQWPNTFESLHSEFTSKLARQGVVIRKGRFPLVAVVFADRVALQNELARQDIPAANVAGIYVLATNRVYTCDIGNQSRTLPVIRHEAAHQSAYNSNVHSRLNVTPKWITEGLGMMFEPAAMTIAASSPIDDRVHRDALAALQNRYGDDRFKLASDMRQMIAGDSWFDRVESIDAAYHVSWLMMYSMSRYHSEKFARLLNHTNTRPPFVDYPADQRVKDFEAIMGQSIETYATSTFRLLKSIR